MKRIALLACAVLAACNNEAPAPAPGATTEAVAPASAIPADAPVVLAFGDSLYAGYQLDPGQGYPPRLEAALNARGVPVRFVSAGVSGDTTAAGLQRLAFTLDNQPVKPALVMVGLGGNDMLRGLPPEETLKNLDAICAEIKRRGLPFMLTGILAAPNMGADYVGKFNAIYPALAKKYDAALVPFLLQPVIGQPGLMLGDNVHPSAAGVEKIVAFTQGDVAKALQAAVGKGAVEKWGK